MVIWWGVADVVYVLYSRVSVHPYYLLEISDILATFGAFMAVLIAIEVFVNIVSYLQDDGLHLDIVLATAYMAVLRKIVILDYKEISPDYVYATAALALALSVGYYLTRSLHRTQARPHGERPQPVTKGRKLNGPWIAHPEAKEKTPPLPPLRCDPASTPPDPASTPPRRLRVTPPPLVEICRL